MYSFSIQKVLFLVKARWALLHYCFNTGPWYCQEMLKGGKRGGDHQEIRQIGVFFFSKVHPLHFVWTRSCMICLIIKKKRKSDPKNKLPR